MTTLCVVVLLDSSKCQDFDTETRNSYDLFQSHRARGAYICDPDIEVCDPLQGAVSKVELDRLRKLDKEQWPRRRPLEVAALG